MRNEKRTCEYCPKSAIGFERVHGTPDNTQVCADCAHENATVHLYKGGTWRKATPTPGPWSVHTDENGKHSVLGFGPLAHLGDTHRSLANARLMAAAPDLLSALCDLLDAYDEVCHATGEHGTCPLAAAAHDAIAKTFDTETAGL